VMCTEHKSKVRVECYVAEQNKAWLRRQGLGIQLQGCLARRVHKRVTAGANEQEWVQARLLDEACRM
jgi:hypothetical protein